MMTQAFYTGISGIRSSLGAIDVNANNLANINTVGYREYDVEFASMFESMLSTANNSSSVDSSIGVGSRLQTTTMMQNTGVLQLSDRSTDLAIYGDGWFGVKGDGESMYTRAGNFTFDLNNDLITPEGLHVLGTMGSGTTDETLLGDITVQEKLSFPKILSYPPEPTTNTKFIGNLGVDDETRTMGAGVVDSQGNNNNLRLSFTKTVPQVLPGSQWNVVATTQTLDGATIYDTQTGVVSFNSAGTLISTTLASINNNGASVQIDLGSGFDGLICTGNASISASSISDGSIGGDLMGYEINKNAEVIATFTNGVQSSVGKIAVYHFQNDRGLDRVDGSRFKESSNSGEPMFFKDENGQNILGTNVTNFKLEGSNVEMSKGLTELIILQRSFGANSKSVTTADEMMQKALSMDA